jgi:hypothetical protein
MSPANTDPALSNSLTVLAESIKAEHDAVSVALCQSVAHAMNAGDLLLEAKDQLKHGDWLLWLREKCSLRERTAQRYMRLAKNRATIEANPTRLSDLSLDGALALLTVPRETADDNLLQSYVDDLDAREILAQSLRSQAETARRRVVLEQAGRNLEATGKIIERLGIDRAKPVSKETEKIVAELFAGLPDPETVSAAYSAAVEADNYDLAFAWAEWLHGFTVDMLGLAQEGLAKVEAGGVS